MPLRVCSARSTCRTKHPASLCIRLTWEAAMYLIRFDMRAPAFGAATTDLYAAAIDMSSWAEQHGCLAAVLCEHHGSEDGYLPSPLILAAAIAARTERLMLSLV